MPESSEAKADCYSAQERGAMEWTQRLRGRLLSPLLNVLARAGVTADHITLLALLLGLSFCPLYFWSPLAAFVMLALHVLLDGLDGPLARHTGTASRKGSLTDSTADQLVIAATTITLMATPEHVIGVLPGGVYIFLYTLVVAFAMVRNALGIPYSWLVRPRFYVYGWLLVETYLWLHTIDWVLWGFNALLAYKMATGFFKIRNKM
jgi:phosphatidylglycerophosphate synthase